jgi:4-hydroxy-tetrahydrodipicolinate synthase
VSCAGGLNGPSRSPWYSFGVNGFQGVHAAAITPRGRHGEVDYGAAFELLDHLSQGGASGVLLFGPAGEYPAFAPDERARLVYLSRKRSRVPVLAGVGSATLDASIDLAREAQNAGVAALVLPPPHFFRYDQDDLRAYFCQFAAELGSDPPILIYRTTALAEETAEDLWQTGKFGAIIDDAGDPESVDRLIAAGVAVFPADDSAAARPGRCALVSAAACAVPELLSGLYQALRNGPEARVRELDAALQEFLRRSAYFPETAAVRLATGLRGLKTGALAVPLSPAKQKELDGFRDWFQQWLPSVRKLAAGA